MKDWARVEVRGQAELRRWLAANHRQADPIWLVTAKKGHDGHLGYDAIVEEALCQGWVDSLPRALDDHRSMLLLSPRKPGSAWSAPNRARVERLIASRRMRPAGQAKVDAAKADGSWDFLKTAETGRPPRELARALTAAGATRGFAALSAAVRRRAIEWLLRARRDETRAKRIAAIVAAAREGRDPTAWRRPA